MEKTNNSINENIIPILNSGIDMFKLFSDKEGFIEHGVNFNSDTKDPTTNIYQQNFSGTSNVYSPYLYYSDETKNKVTQPITKNQTPTQTQTPIINNFTDVNLSINDDTNNNNKNIHHETISNPDIHYENKRIELNSYSDILH
jgi:hypothetical protein